MFGRCDFKCLAGDPIKLLYCHSFDICTTNMYVFILYNMTRYKHRRKETELTMNKTQCLSPVNGNDGMVRVYKFFFSVIAVPSGWSWVDVWVLKKY